MQITPVVTLQQLINQAGQFFNAYQDIITFVLAIPLAYLLIDTILDLVFRSKNSAGKGGI